MKSITVLVVTYNQEDIISRCLDSILIQKAYGLKHIVVCDDCSMDKTWEVLKSYAEKYPDIVKPYRNETNMGIYPNSQKVVSLRGEADLFTQLAGDDVLCDGWFKEVQLFVDKNQIDFSIPIGIYSDWRIIGSDGKETIICQSLVDSGISLFSLHLRGMATSMALLINEKVIGQYEPIVLGRGLNLTESAYDSQDSRIIKKAYYLPSIGSTYYSGIGISTKLSIEKSDYSTIQQIEKLKYFIDNYIEEEADLWYAKYEMEIAKYYMLPSLYSIFKVLLYYHRGRLKGITYHIKDYFIIILRLLRFWGLMQMK